MAYSLAGSVGGLLLAFVVFGSLGQHSQVMQYLVLGIAISVVGLISMGVCIAGVWKTAIRCDRERLVRSMGEPPALPVMQQLKIVLSNRPFMIVCGIYLFSWMAMQFTASVLPLYVKNWMRLPDSQFPLVALAVQGTALLMIPVWGTICTRIGKKPVYFLGIPFWLAAQVGLVFLQPDQVNLMYAMAFMAGLGISVCYLVPNAMLPDVIEYDELRTGQRREGIYYGFFVFLQKMALALGSAILGQTLAAAGFLSSAAGEAVPVQPDSALWAIRMAIGPLPALVLVIGLVCAFFFPINKARHAEMLAELAARRALKQGC